MGMNIPPIGVQRTIHIWLKKINLFNDLVGQNELYNERIKYYANILTPFSPLVIKKIQEVLSFNVHLDIIRTSQGISEAGKEVNI
jgi:flavorubredoxin